MYMYELVCRIKYRVITVQVEFNSKGGVSNVDKMSEWERKKVFEKFLQSQEVAITLVYSDGSTQLRENLDATNSSNTKVYKIISVGTARTCTFIKLCTWYKLHHCTHVL